MKKAWAEFVSWCKLFVIAVTIIVALGFLVWFDKVRFVY